MLREVARLLVAQAGSIDPADLQRARNQVEVRTLRTREDPARRLEEAALDLFARGQRAGTHRTRGAARRRRLNGLGRDDKAVHGDRTALLKAGVLNRAEGDGIVFPFDTVEVEFMLQAA